MKECMGNPPLLFLVISVTLFQITLFTALAPIGEIGHLVAPPRMLSPFQGPIGVSTHGCSTLSRFELNVQHLVVWVSLET